MEKALLNVTQNPEDIKEKTDEFENKNVSEYMSKN